MREGSAWLDSRMSAFDCVSVVNLRMKDVKSKSKHAMGAIGDDGMEAEEGRAAMHRFM